MNSIASRISQCLTLSSKPALHYLYSSDLTSRKWSTPEIYVSTLRSCSECALIRKFHFIFL